MQTRHLQISTASEGLEELMGHFKRAEIRRNKASAWDQILLANEREYPKL
jgi:hypothetical protein